MYDAGVVNSEEELGEGSSAQAEIVDRSEVSLLSSQKLQNGTPRNGARRVADFGQAVVKVDSQCSNSLAVVDLSHRGTENPLSLARSEVERRPSHASGWEMLGLLLSQMGERDESFLCFKQAQRLQPRSAVAVYNLGIAAQLCGRLKDAESLFERAVRLDPQSLEYKINLARMRGALGFHDRALEIVEKLLSRNPRHIPAILLAASLESDRGRYIQALVWIDSAIRLEPSRVESYPQRAEVLGHLHRWEDALTECDRILLSQPHHAKALHQRAIALKSLNRIDEALVCFQRAEQEEGARAGAAVLADRASLLAELGEKDEAVALLNEAVRRQPDLTSAWANLSFLRAGADERAVENMEALFANPNCGLSDRVNLGFALGQAYLKRGDGQKAFERLEIGNRLKRSTFEYDYDAEARRMEQIKSIFSQKNLAQFEGLGNSSAKPIFVFGMPRSGTTLVEQILASHRSVYGAGEVVYLSDLVQRSQFGAGLGLVGQDLRAMGAKYLELMEAECGPSERFIDKMTWNFLYAGLISVILPNARMIHCRRDPLDTCLSCYSILFASGHPYAYNLSELGKFYRLYQGLTTHWRNVVGRGRLIEIEYEQMVSEPEESTRRLLDFCALPWEPNCLEFHKTRRRVTSASLDQVRSPLYKSSVGRARRYVAWLGPLVQELSSTSPD
jgi:tetratricopeptide (TPR) repeat protein